MLQLSEFCLKPTWPDQAKITHRMTRISIFISG